MVGRNRSFLRGLEHVDPPVEVYLLEEPELVARWDRRPFHSPILKQVRTAHYQYSLEGLPVALAWHEEQHFDAVIPGVEYAVPLAGRIARTVGTDSLGEHAELHLTNKLRLRQLAQRAGLNQPAFAAISSAADVERFFRRVPVVIKPANRQASSGVVKVTRPEEIPAAYASSVGSREAQVVAAEVPQEYLVEEYVVGPEVSVESLIQDGGAIFHNITTKLLTAGQYFVELGHVVPAILEADQAVSLIANQETFIRALGAQDGFLHAEWKIPSGEPVLIECAGRPAGDHIPDLIELAYHFSVYGAMVDIASGQPLAPLPPPSRGACIRYFEAPPGRLRRISGTDRLTGQEPRLVDWEITVKDGDTIEPLTSSWSRIGHVMTTGPDNVSARDCASNLVSSVVFEVEPGE